MGGRKDAAAGADPGGRDDLMIARFRRTEGLTQEELAERLGVCVSTIKKWESGLRRPPGYLRLALLAVKARLT